jgi:hypothetical protein
MRTSSWRLWPLQGSVEFYKYLGNDQVLKKDFVLWSYFLCLFAYFVFFVFLSSSSIISFILSYFLSVFQLIDYSHGMSCPLAYEHDVLYNWVYDISSVIIYQMRLFVCVCMYMVMTMDSIAPGLGLTAANGGLTAPYVILMVASSQETSLSRGCWLRVMLTIQIMWSYIITLWKTMVKMYDM